MNIDSVEYVKMYVSNQIRKYIGMDTDINDINIICNNIKENKLISKTIYNKVEECINKAHTMTSDERLKLSYSIANKYDDKLLVNTIEHAVSFIMTDVNYKYECIKNDSTDIDSMKNIVVHMIMRGLIFMDKVVEDIVLLYLKDNNQVIIYKK